MIHIYLCEDDTRQLNRWEDIISKYLLMNPTETKLYCATSKPEELLSMRRRSGTTGLYFLDIDLQSNKNGIELAQEIRKYDPRGYVVFVTTHSEMAVLTFRYKVEAMDFITKDDAETLPEQICSCIRNAERNYKVQLDASNRLLSIKVDKDSLVLDQNDIVAITTGDDSHKLTVHTRNGVRQISGSLKEYHTTLNSNFCQCNRSTIINLKHVTKYSRESALLLMNNRETYSVSIRMMGKVQKALNNIHP
ncbi:LytR/AlgR family response regulator transcription factor [Lacrimispora saccharolytica]|uniref:Stage 0 sporulation protein A homolog n=1 Tax=Lacrimispora saccharolytica (strain ATCC 35040 / DSM 2544 / NRCC 2533 / WM1) TaxID=610130 RepID=D9R060_LACSW|nr:LytTR family DNA-binding domain-containing protein [Lacrimispora saccharolytica]ADL04511.1 two component transcriptional regulator, LytTR family [[Clostridium] saccharolyticum WM1]QRV21232.1 response regulator transcription factor [Lacrimispora saccharolytica]